jgi:hypothetical protein
MKGDDILAAIGDVGKSWTRQIKAEEKRPAARQHRKSMYAEARVALKEICYALMEQAYMQASDDGRLPTHWRQVFYVMRPLVDAHPDSDRPLIDATFKGIIEGYLEDYEPGWDILRGARGVFKEPHRAESDSGLPMSTMNVRNYLGAGQPSLLLEHLPSRFPTIGAHHRIGAILICEKEGFDDLLEAERVPDRYDLALMSTKGISARAARDLAEGLCVPCFTLHDFDKNGFVMAAGFPFAVDLGIRLDDIDDWGLQPEPQQHKNEDKTWRNLVDNGATRDEADFIADGNRVELNMFTSADLIKFITGKLDDNGVKKVIPDDETLAAAWRRARHARRVNGAIDSLRAGKPITLSADVPTAPEDLVDLIVAEFEVDDTQAWDDVVWELAGDR